MKSEHCHTPDMGRSDMLIKRWPQPATFCLETANLGHSATPRGGRGACCGRWRRSAPYHLEPVSGQRSGGISPSVAGNAERTGIDNSDSVRRQHAGL